LELALFIICYATLAAIIVQNDGEHNANYNTGYHGEEELKAPLVQKYIAGKLF